MSIRTFFIFSTALILVSRSGNILLAQGALTPGAGPAPLFKSLDQIESRIPISGATTISTSGAYYLTANIAVASGNGITIAANNVQLDLKGFTISSTANPASGTAILLSGALTNIVIFDGFIYGAVTNNGVIAYGGSGFANGVNFTIAQPFNACVSDISISGCTAYGINLNSNVGNNTDNSVQRCLIMNCGTSGIVADQVSDCLANSGSSFAIFCSVGARGRGTCYAGAGIHAAASAQDCYGQSTIYYGVDASVIANNCYGVSSTQYGLYSFAANNCYGVTATGGAGIYIGASANNCYGYHSGAGGGVGLSAGSVAHGGVGVNSSSSSGYGIYADNLLSGCVGDGATNSQAKFKVNTP